MPLLSRRRERELLAQAMRGSHSRLITGPPVTSKARLIEEALVSAGVDHIRIAARPGVLNGLLPALASSLNPDGCQRTQDRKATSIALMARILRQLVEWPRCIFLDPVYAADPRTYRFLQKIYYPPRCSLVLATSSRPETGYLSKLLWDPREEIKLKPLPRSAAYRMFDLVARRHHLGRTDISSLRRRVVSAAHGIPGLIVAICRLAEESEYRSGDHILFAPLCIDARILTAP